MRKRYKQITAVILAAMMAMQNGGVHVLASTDYSNKGSLHEEKNREGGAKKTATDSDAEKNAGKEKDVLTASSADASREEPVTDPAEKEEKENAETKKEDGKKENTKKTQHTISAWEWYEGDQYLIDGEQRLTVNERDQVSFDDVVSTLPITISANLQGGDEADGSGETVQIDVAGWNCDAYTQDENGLWPTKGSYVFTAVLPDGYALREGVEKPEVKVTLEEAGIAALADEDYYSRIIINDGKTTPKTGDGYEITDKQNGNYELTLNNFSGSYIFIRSGTWTIKLNGKNKITQNKEKSALLIDGYANVTIEETNDASLEVSGKKYAVNVTLANDNKTGGKLTLKSGTVTAKTTASGTAVDLNDAASLTVSGTAKLIVNAAEDGISKWNNAVIKDNASVEVTSNTGYGIFAIGGFKILNNASLMTTTNSTRPDRAALYLEECSATFGTTNSVQLTGGNKGAYGLIIWQEQKATITSGNVTVDSIRNSGTLDLNSGMLEITQKYEGKPNDLKNNGGTLTGNGSIASGLVSLKAEISPPYVSYNGESQTPTVTIKKEDDSELNQSSYTLFWKSAADNSKVDKMINAGFYYPVITMNGTTTPIRLDKTFQIGQKQLKATLRENNYTKVYDGTTEWKNEKPTLILSDNNGTVDDISVDKDKVRVSYESAEVGKNKIIKVENVKLTGTGADNYAIERNFGDQYLRFAAGSITKANLSNVSVSQRESLTYNGTELTPEISITADGVNGESYSNSGTKTIDGFEIQYKTDAGAEYSSAIPKFTKAGNYTVYYKITSKNYNDVLGDSNRFDVIVGKTSPEFTLENATQTYTGASLKPTLKAKINSKDVAISADEYSLSYKKEDGSRASLTEVTEAGTYIVTATFTGEAANNFQNPSVEVGRFTISPKSLSENDIEVAFANPQLTYNQTTQDPGDVTIKDKSRSDTVLESGKDYQLKTEPENVKNAGIYTYVFKGLGNYTGEITATVTIAPRSLTGATVTVKDSTEGNYRYNAAEWEPDAANVTVTVDGLTVPSNEYQLTYNNNKNAGEATVTVTAKADGNYKDSATGKFTIRKADLTSTEVKQTGTLTYNGNKQQAKVSIDAAGVSGEIYSDPGDGSGSAGSIAGFTIRYGTDEDNITSPTVPEFTDAGTHTVYYQITSDNYESKTGSFEVTIAQADLSKVDFALTDATQNQIFNGASLNPTIAAKIGSTNVVIPEGSYKLSYTEIPQEGKTSGREIPQDGPVNVGTYKVTVTITSDDGNFQKGTSQDVSTEFEISPKNISDGSIKIAFEQPELTYNKKEQDPGTITISDESNGNELENETDYAITTVPANKVNVGTYTYEFTGKGNYTGTTTADVKIVPCSLNGATVTVKDSEEGEYIYHGSEWTPGKQRPELVTVTTADGQIVSPDEYQLTYADNIKAGMATVTVTANRSVSGYAAGTSSQNENYADSAAGIFTIQKAPLKLAGAMLASKTYDGTDSAEVTAAVLNGQRGPEQDTSPLQLGTDYVAKASYTDVNAGTGKMARVEVTLLDTPKAANYKFCSEDDSMFMLQEQVIHKTASNALPAIPVSYSFGRTGKQSVALTGLPDDIGELLGASAEITDDSIGALEDDVSVEGDKVIFTLSGNKMENIGKTATITIRNIQTTNYEDMTQKLVITMDPKKDQAAVAAPMEYQANADGETFTAVITPVEGAEYSFDGENWSENNKKTDCQSDMEYTGYIRMKETEELYTGAESEITVKAPKAEVKAPVISPEDTRIWQPVMVSLSTPTGDAVIYYTLDGSEPTRESARYTEPFAVNRSLTVKAFAVREHFADSAVTTQEFNWYDTSDDSDWEPDSKTSSSGKTSQSTAAGTRADAKKGQVNAVTGIITGEGNDYSRWEASAPSGTASGIASVVWKLRYADGTYAAGTVKTRQDGSTYVDHCWELVNGRWYAFDENAALRTGWIYDEILGHWFYVDPDQGMKTGWHRINGKWYYFHTVSDGTRGRMYSNTRTPDGYYVGKDGSWDGKGKTE